MIRSLTLCAAALALSFGLAACGGQESTPSADADVASQPSAAEGATGAGTPARAPSGGAAGGAATGTAATGTAVTSPIVASCLDLASRQQWTQAVPACTRALGVDPNNNEVQKALSNAKTQVASGTAAAAAKMAEGQAAADNAAASAAATKKSAEDTAAAAGALGKALGGTGTE